MRTLWAALAAAALGLAPLAAFSAPAEGTVLVEASCFPNPFDSRRAPATLRWTLASEAPVEVAVHSVFGAPGGRPGPNEVAWDGADDTGRKVSKGLYLLVLRAAGERRVVKVGVRH